MSDESGVPLEPSGFVAALDSVIAERDTARSERDVLAARVETLESGLREIERWLSQTPKPDVTNSRVAIRALLVESPQETKGEK